MPFILEFHAKYPRKNQSIYWLSSRNGPHTISAIHSAYIKYRFQNKTMQNEHWNGMKGKPHQPTITQTKWKKKKNWAIIQHIYIACGRWGMHDKIWISYTITAAVCCVFRRILQKPQRNNIRHEEDKVVGKETGNLYHQTYASIFGFLFVRTGCVYCALCTLYAYTFTNTYESGKAVHGQSIPSTYKLRCVDKKWGCFKWYSIYCILFHSQVLIPFSRSFN